MIQITPIGSPGVPGSQGIQVKKRWEGGSCNDFLLTIQNYVRESISMLGYFGLYLSYDGFSQWSKVHDSGTSGIAL